MLGLQNKICSEAFYNVQQKLGIYRGIIDNSFVHQFLVFPFNFKRVRLKEACLSIFETHFNQKKKLSIFMLKSQDQNRYKTVT